MLNWLHEVAVSINFADVKGLYIWIEYCFYLNAYVCLWLPENIFRVGLFTISLQTKDFSTTGRSMLSTSGAVLECLNLCSVLLRCWLFKLYLQFLLVFEFRSIFILAMHIVSIVEMSFGFLLFQFLGSIVVLESMKSLDFSTRTAVAKLVELFAFFD